MKKVNVGLIGAGTVGMGVADAILSNGQLIAERTGVSLVLKGVCDTSKAALDAIKAKEVQIKTSRAEELIDDEDIDIIVELVGGVQPAKDLIISALKKKKHVVTANKALLSGNWKEIAQIASDNGVFVNFEASVGGGIPIIRTLRQSFAANRIETVYGILNGTTNFILTMMADNGCSFDEALAVAQEKGIAEKDPELDVSGKDSAHKLAILALLGYGVDVSQNDIYTEGITGIGPQDIVYASRWGYSIKLLAIAKDSDEGLQLRVHPTLLSSAHLLSDIKNEDNAIFVKGDLVGEALLFGKGAGRKPTASSVMGDIIQTAKHVAFFGSENPAGYNLNYAAGKKSVSKMEDLSISYYFRFSVIDKPGVLASIASILAKNEISIANVSQEERNEGEEVPVIILTHRSQEGNMNKAIQEIGGMDYVAGKTVVIRREE